MLVQHANNKDAVAFQRELIEKIEATVGQVLNETRMEIASMLFENPNGFTSSAGGVSSTAAGGKVGKDRVSDEIKSELGSPPGGTALPHVSKMPTPESNGKPVLPAKIGEETVPEKKDSSEKRTESKGKRAVRFAMKKKYDKQHESVQVS